MEFYLGWSTDVARTINRSGTDTLVFISKKHGVYVICCFVGLSAITTESMVVHSTQDVQDYCIGCCIAAYCVSGALERFYY
jgi:hypothetical protein